MNDWVRVLGVIVVCLGSVFVFSLADMMLTKIIAAPDWGIVALAWIVARQYWRATDG